jgi:hypothetical protein
MCANKITEELFNEADLRMLEEKKKGIHLLSELASYPPLNTPHFNEDGSNKYR